MVRNRFRRLVGAARGDLDAVFGPLEVRVLDALWHNGEASVRDLQSAFPDAAYTTLMTTLDRLHRKGVLDRAKTGRAFVYRPRFTPDGLRANLLGHVLGVLVGRDRGAMRPVLSHFVEAVSDRDAALLDELERLVREKRQEKTR